ncbi:MFS transporter [Escherichia coli]
MLVVILQAITLLATVIGSRSGSCDGGMKKVILSLALGTFGLGMARFGIMGVLTELAHNVGISIPAAGHIISYYALGVVVGAPIIALFSSRYSLKHILLFLVALCVIGNAMFTLSSSYLMLAIGRLVSAFRMAHFLASARSCYQKLSNPEKSPPPWRGWFPDDVANLLGIPLGTY